MKTEQVGHTPGPWRYRRTYSNGEEVGCAVMPMGYDLSTSNLDENEANARLIAAAPELLAACQSLMRAEGMQRGDRDGCTMGEISQAIDAARAAIAKALGHE